MSVFEQQNLLDDSVKTDTYKYIQIHTDKYIQIHADKYTSKTVSKCWLLFYLDSIRTLAGSRWYLYVSVCIDCISMYLHSIIQYQDLYQYVTAQYHSVSGLYQGAGVICMYLSVLTVLVCICTVSLGIRCIWLYCMYLFVSVCICMYLFVLYV